MSTVSKKWKVSQRWSGRHQTGPVPWIDTFCILRKIKLSILLRHQEMSSERRVDLNYHNLCRSANTKFIISSDKKYPIKRIYQLSTSSSMHGPFLQELVKLIIQLLLKQAHLCINDAASCKRRKLTLSIKWLRKEHHWKRIIVSLIMKTDRLILIIQVPTTLCFTQNHQKD